MLAMSRLTGLPLEKQVAEKALADLYSCRPEVSAADIISAVASFFNVSPDELRGTRRTRSIAQPRQIAMYLMREKPMRHFPRSAPSSGEDHATVLYGYERVRARLEQDDGFQT